MNTATLPRLGLNDPRFVYVHSSKTDIRETFRRERVRLREEAAIREGNELHKAMQDSLVEALERTFGGDTLRRTWRPSPIIAIDCKKMDYPPLR